MTPSHLAVRQAVDRMNDELRQRYEELQTLLAEATGKDVRARYRIGRLIADVKLSEHRYGSRAVKNLAAALGRDEATLYRFALVAEAWTEPELEVLLTRKTPHGEPLSFSHLVELAQMSDKGARQEMLEYALSYGVSVRELIEAIADPCGDRHERRSESGPSLDSLLRRVATTCDALQHKIEISELLLTQLDEADPNARPSLTELLTRAVSSQRAILEASTRSIERLERARQRLGGSQPPVGIEMEAPIAPPAASSSTVLRTAPARGLRRHSVPNTTAPRTPPPRDRHDRTPRLLAGFAR